jgi:hypothetical protein
VGEVFFFLLFFLSFFVEFVLCFVLLLRVSFWSCFVFKMFYMFYIFLKSGGGRDVEKGMLKEKGFKGGVMRDGKRRKEKERERHILFSISYHISLFLRPPLYSPLTLLSLLSPFHLPFF